MPPVERLGLFGGTFDPVHIAHLAAAHEAHAALRLDRTLLVVAPDPWQKHGEVVAPAELRYEMVAASVTELPGLEASRLELERHGPTYTVDTVEALAREGPRRELFLIVGADVAKSIHTWHRADDLRAHVTLAVVTRDGSEHVRPEGWRVAHVAMPRLDVSSTDMRDRIATGRPIDVFVPSAAVRIIREHGLYTRP